jgi:hypothetical protein
VWRRLPLAAICVFLPACGLFSVEEGTVLDLVVENRTAERILVTDIHGDQGTVFEVAPCAAVRNRTAWSRGQSFQVEGEPVLTIDELSWQIRGIRIVVAADGSTSAVLVETIPDEPLVEGPCA